MNCFSTAEKRRTFRCKVVLLDDTQLIQELQPSARGQELLDIVFRHLNLLETAYFGLRYIDSDGQTHWLDTCKSVLGQLNSKNVNPMTLYFNVKFYAADPCKLVEEITRYQFFLQVKQDILHSRLPVSFELASELFALAVQSELGDYDPRHHQSGYISEFRFLPAQTPEIEQRVSELHKGLMGQVPATCENQFLERVKWLDLYGMDLHPVLGDDEVEYFLGLAPSGIIVLRNKSKVGAYFWPRIVKVTQKQKYFMARVLEKNSDERTYGFRLPSKEAAKHLHQCCTEHQAFFKLSQDKESLMKRGNGGKLTGFALRFRQSIRRASFRGQQPGGSLTATVDRAPPMVVRVPSRRYRRRFGPDGADSSTVPKDETFKENGYLEVSSSIVVPAGRHVTQPIVYRTISSGAIATQPESPKSSRSAAPWENPRQRGLFSSSTNPSPKSTRSALAYRTATLSNGYHDVDNNANHYRYRHRGLQSDAESQVSKCSKSSRHSRHSNRSSSSHHRCRHRRQSSSAAAGDPGEQSGTESDCSRKRHRRRKCCESKKDSYKMVDTAQQWQEIQKRQQENSSICYQTPRSAVAVLRDMSQLPQISSHHQQPHRRHISGYMSGQESETEPNTASTLNRTKRKQHLRTLSDNGKNGNRQFLSHDLKKHIMDYKMVEPSSKESDIRNDISYTKVETDAVFRFRYSPTTGRARGKLTRDFKKGNSAGSSSTDSKSTAEMDGSGSGDLAPPLPVRSVRSSAFGLGHSSSADSNNETASNSSNSVNPGDSSNGGNMLFRPVGSNGGNGSSILNSNNQRNLNRYANGQELVDNRTNSYNRKTMNSFDMSGRAAGTTGVGNTQYPGSYMKAAPQIGQSYSNHSSIYANPAINYENTMSSPPRVTFAQTPLTTYYSSERSARNGDFGGSGDRSGNGFVHSHREQIKTPSEMATEL